MASLLNPAQAPVDGLRKSHKVTHKTWEHNLAPSSTFQTELDGLLVQLSSAPGQLDPAQAAAAQASVDSLLSKMRALKRKLAELGTQSSVACEGTSRRLEHLSALPSSLSDSAYPAWARRRLSLQLAEHWLRADPPLRESASALVAEEALEGMVDGERWDELARCEAALGRGEVGEAMRWAGENRAALRKLKSPLEFSLHLQSFIELCRGRELAKAIVYSRQHLSGLAAQGEDAARLGELQNAMSLLAFPETTTCPAYQVLYSAARWTQLRALFRSTFLALHSLPPLPLLHMSLQAGLAALKTGACIPLVPSAAPSPTLSATSSATALGPAGSLFSAPHTHTRNPPFAPVPGAGYQVHPGTSAPIGVDLEEDEEDEEEDDDMPDAPHSTAFAPPKPSGAASTACPICSSPLKVLAGEVPYSHHVNSTVVCPLSGRVVEGDGGEGGNLVALVGRATMPGAAQEARVYSKEGLRSWSEGRAEGGRVVDPRSGEEYAWGELKRVFIS